MFGQYQRLTDARLSVPKENRRRDRFGGTQNSLFQTVDYALQGNNSMLDANDNSQQRTFFDQNARKTSIGSFDKTHTPRVVKSSLLGTSARQKLLQYKLAKQHADQETKKEDKAQIVNQMAEIDAASNGNNQFDQLKDVNVGIKERTADKRSKRERMIE